MRAALFMIALAIRDSTGEIAGWAIGGYVIWLVIFFIMDAVEFKNKLKQQRTRPLPRMRLSSTERI